MVDTSRETGQSTHETLKKPACAGNSFLFNDISAERTLNEHLCAIKSTKSAFILLSHASGLRQDSTKFVAAAVFARHLAHFLGGPSLEVDRLSVSVQKCMIPTFFIRRILNGIWAWPRNKALFR